MKFAYQSILFGTLISVCACKPNLDIPAPAAGDADFSKSIAIGGNYMSGYQDGALFHDGQD
ncbi:MAG: hypothetical protein M3R17_09615, partial [Bacteroidota bacterium]|nr:hypothetical protein [Bacteroidota bacterium]